MTPQPPPPTPSADIGLIYDVGMNNGDDSAFYLKAGFRVVAIEANPLLCRAAEKRFAAEIASGRFVVLNLAISDQPGEIDFWVNTEVSEWSSLIRSVAERAGHRVERIVVPTEPVDRVILAQGLPHYLKIDIECADELCLNALARLQARPPQVSVEFTEEKLIHTLSGLGYRRYKLVEQVSHLPVGDAPGLEGVQGRVGRVLLTGRGLPARLVRKVVGFDRLLRRTRPSRRFAGLTFPDGASGTFGDDIPSSWMTLERTLEHWKAHTVAWKRCGRDFWCDLHAGF
jgi:FkbM family methyltransferase